MEAWQKHLIIEAAWKALEKDRFCAHGPFIFHVNGNITIDTLTFLRKDAIRDFPVGGDIVRRLQHSDVLQVISPSGSERRFEYVGTGVSGSWWQLTPFHNGPQVEPPEILPKVRRVIQRMNEVCLIVREFVGL